MTNHEGPPSTPRWVKVLGTTVIVLIVLFLILHILGIGGEHGPSRHLSFKDVGYNNSIVQQGITLS